MPTGMYCKAAGPGPATPAGFFLNENIAVPQFLTSFTHTFHWNNDNYARGPVIDNWDGQGQLMFVLSETSWSGDFANAGIIFTVTQAQVLSNKQIELRIRYDHLSEMRNITVTVYKIWPQADRGYGMSFYNSSDVMNITDTGTIGQCIWAWEGNIVNELRVPDISGFNMNNAFLFANFNNGGMGLQYGTDRVVRVYQNRNGLEDNNFGGTLYARLALFSNNPNGVEEHNGGFNIYTNDRSGRVAFSSRRTPFIVNGFISSTGGNTGISYPMGLLLPSYGGIYGGNSTSTAQHTRSMVISGSSIYTGFGARMYRGKLSVASDDICLLTFPVLNAANYFDSIGHKL